MLAPQQHPVLGLFAAGFALYFGSTSLEAAPNPGAPNPVVQAQSTWVASDGAPLDWFGFAIAKDSGWSVAGAPFRKEGGVTTGAVYALEGATGLEFKIMPDTPEEGSRFGSALALEGNTLVVGAPGSGSATGAAFVFERSGITWAQVARLDGLPGHAGDGFGTSVAISGDRILIGAPWNNLNGAQAGAAFAFEVQGGNWVLADELRAPATGPGDAFGYAVDMGPRWAVVGAYSANPFVFNEGSVTAFEFTTGSYSLHSSLLDGDPTPNSTFGRSVSLYADRVAVGATRDHASLSESGQVTLFGFDGSNWLLETTLKPDDELARNAFGYSVALGADRVLVGAPGANGTSAASGAVTLFEPISGAWYQTYEAAISSAQTGDFVGVSVALDPEGALAGAMRDQTLGWQAGAVHTLDAQEIQTPWVLSLCGCEDVTPCGSPGGANGCPNSVGSGAVMGVEGSTSIAADDMVLRMSGIQPGQFGFFWMGDGATNVALYDGFRCVTANQIGLFRLSLSIADAGGVMRTGPGIVNAFTASQGPLLVGAQWCFQGVYRDSGGPCGQGVNLSDAIWVTFQN